MDFSARAGLNVSPCDKYLGGELSNRHVSEKLWVLQPPPSSAHRVPPSENMIHKNRQFRVLFKHNYYKCLIVLKKSNLKRLLTLI